MGLESIDFVGAFILLIALIYGVLSCRYRNRGAVRAGGEIAALRYRRDETRSFQWMGSASGVDLTFATQLAVSSSGECQILNSTRNKYLLVVLRF
jgi:hypothetical protein